MWHGVRVKKASWDSTSEDIRNRIAGFESVNISQETVTVMIHNAYNLTDAYRAFLFHGYDFKEWITISKAYKKKKRFKGVGHIHANLWLWQQSEYYLATGAVGSRRTNIQLGS